MQYAQSAILATMKRTIRILLCMSLMSFLLACDSSGNGAETNAVGKSGGVEEKGPAAYSSKLFDREITKKPCDLLTPDTVAELAGVDSSALEQRNIAGMCRYSWDGGEASLAHLSTSATIEFARRNFENAYGNQTGEEVAKSMGVIDDELEKQKAEGKTDVDPEQAKLVSGAMNNLLSGGFQFEDVAGLGDVARFDVTRSEMQILGKTMVFYANSLNVLVRNLKFTVSFNREGEPKLYRDENVALAEAVLKKLPD